VYFIVANYIFNNATTTDDVFNLWINPVLGLPEGAATIPNVTSTATDALSIGAFYLRQGTAANASTQKIDAVLVGTTWAVVTPVSSPTLTTITPSSANVGDPGFTITVDGTNFASGNSTVTWNGTNRTTTFVSATQLTASIPASDLSTSGTATVGVTTTGAAAPLSNSQLFTINASSGATITLTSALTAFGNVCINNSTAANSFTIDGSNLTGSNISVDALPGFTYSENLAGPYTSSINFSYTGNSFTGKLIYVIFSPTIIQSYSGNILLNGGGIVNYPVPAAGVGVNDAPSVTTGTPSAITATSALVSGTINSIGCAVITAYGFEYSSNSGFVNGTGIQVAASNLSAGNFSATISGLSPNTRYYYKAYATNSIGTTYGTQQAFTNTALPVLMSAQPGLSFTETFADIANWSNFFITGTGANHFSGLSAVGTGGIPNGTTLTASTLSFQGATFGSSGGVQKGTDQLPPTQSIVLLSTGPGDNTTSAAIDFYMDFTGVNAGTLSFDWASVNNSTGDRNGSMRVYASTDGVSFTELTFASVLNFTNNVPTNGSKTNIALPASFNNSATARLRFYYYNGTGGITPTGSRPKISIDNLNVTALATTPCASPTAPATALVFGTITDVSIQGSFTAASPVSDGYLVVMSTNSSLTGNPIDGQIYNIGDNVGDGSVIAKGVATSFTATGLSPLTSYYFFIFPVNSVCTGGPLYYTINVLNGMATTIAGLPPCTAPGSQATSLIFGTTNSNSIQGSFTATTADEYLVVRSTSTSLSTNPINGQAYVSGDAIGNGLVVQRSNATTFTANNLLPNTPYYFFIFSDNSLNCVNGPVYNVNSPLSGMQATLPLPPCVTPSAQPTDLRLTASNTLVAGTFVASSATDDYLIIQSISPSLSATPVNNTDYNTGDNFGGGTVIANRASNTFVSTSLTLNTTYYYFVFAANKTCSGGTKYATQAPLTGNIVTTNALANNYYFGTLHSHSDYSDGNQDHPGYTPTDDYNYAMTALCMDYLGISEHNHFSSPDNPGNSIGTYHMGSTEATSFSSIHPNFLALYGMEWGVISGGGHVVVYGNNLTDLWGWESGSGGWGATNNYDVYVPKSVYTGSTGLFKTINDNIAKNAFATLAHPGFTDYNNLANVSYDPTADNAIAGTAVESGPASSTNTTYSNPGSSMSYLWYYQTLLSKGYHLGPTIDHDNHKTTFGHTTYSRTAIVATTLTQSAIVSSMRNLQFYATQDCDSKVDFTINTKAMGSTVLDRYAPNIFVILSDATTSTSSAIIKVMFGVPGSGTMAVKVDSIIGNTLNFTDESLADLATGYYYIDITNGSSRIVTSPIWYTRNDNAALPVRLSVFTVQKVGNVAKINWATEQETNSSHFIVERSLDGRTWNPIARVNSAGNSSHRVDYITTDNAPIRGINYYRLKQVDIDGRFIYSDIKSALFNSAYTAQVAPNPAKGYINLYLSKSGNQSATVEVLNMQGKTVYRIQTTQSSLQIPAMGFSKGLYVVKVIDEENVTSIKVSLQ
ncbi:MAG: T9SS type A sorting domain-containing protein, partial [Ferruginibacter sp.]